MITYSSIFLRRENWRSTGNTNRRGGGGGGNTSKQTTYNSNNNRYPHNPNQARNPRYADNRTTYEGRDSPLQTTTEEPTRNQRVNSGNFSQGQPSGPTSPPTAVAGRTIYSNTHRSSANRNSPATSTGSSSSRNNSLQNTTSPPNQQTGTNKLAKKPSLRKNEQFRFRIQSIFVYLTEEQQPTNDEFDQQPKPQRSSNTQSNTNSINRPTQLQSKQQTSAAPPPAPISLPTQDENISSHDTMNSNTPGTTYVSLNMKMCVFSHNRCSRTPNSTKSNGGLNPEADEFVPVFSVCISLGLHSQQKEFRQF